MSCHADYLGLDRNVTARVNRNRFADGIFAWEELALQTLVYDHYSVGALIVAVVEESALEQRNPHRVKVVRSREVVHRQGQLAGRRNRPPIYVKEQLVIASVQGKERRSRRRLDSGQAFQLLKQLPV